MTRKMKRVLIAQGLFTIIFPILVQTGAANRGGDTKGVFMGALGLGLILGWSVPLSVGFARLALAPVLTPRILQQPALIWVLWLNFAWSVLWAIGLAVTATGPVVSPGSQSPSSVSQSQTARAVPPNNIGQPDVQGSATAPVYVPQPAPTYAPQPSIPERSPPAPQPWSAPEQMNAPPSTRTYAPPPAPTSCLDCGDCTPHIPLGATLSDGGHSFTAAPGNTAVNISTWNLAQLQLCYAYPDRRGHRCQTCRFLVPGPAPGPGGATLVCQ